MKIRTFNICILGFALSAFGHIASVRAATVAPSPIVVEFFDTNVVLANSEESSPPDMDILVDALRGNRFGLSEDDLEIVPNPDGVGFFVYVKRTSFGGVERKFVWFANGGIVTALNGATKNATPSLLFPREVSEVHLNGTQHDPINITSFAMKLLF